MTSSADMRIPLPSDDELSPESREVLARFPPLNIIRMFANAPSLLEPMAELGLAILTAAELDPLLREVAILAIARTSDSVYERLQHENIGRLVGLPETAIRAAADGHVEALDDDQQLVWRFANQIASDVRADQSLTGQILARFGQRAATELVITCAYYCAIARVIETCGVNLEERLPTADINPEQWG